MTVASAGRSTPAIMPNALCAATTVAPVLPALNSAAASPPATAEAATRIEACGLRRSAAAGDSPMPMVSAASMTAMSSLATSR